MPILVKNKETLIFDEFKFKCSVGKRGFTKNKLEGDKKTPKGSFNLGNLYFRSDKHPKPITKIKTIPITKKMGWCDDVYDQKNYNKLVQINRKNKCEKLYRTDDKYDFLIPVQYNSKRAIPGKGSAIFIHLTSNYKCTDGCIALKKKDFLILIKLINKKTKLKII